MKQTAVEWLEQRIRVELTYEQDVLFDEVFEQAKAMEKEQIIEAVYYNCSSMSHSDLPCGIQYYNETFKSE